MSGIRLAILVPLALAGCAATPPPSDPPIEGKWRIVAVNGRATTGSMAITPPKFHATFGCNDGRGNARVEPGALVIEALAVTERGCTNPDGSASDAMLGEGEGFRIASGRTTYSFFGPTRARLSNERGTIDLER